MLPRRRSILRIWKGSSLLSKRRDVAHRADVDLAARQERDRAAEIDREAALDPAEDRAVTLAVSLNACSSLFQLSSRRAFSRDSSASPLLVRSARRRPRPLADLHLGGWPGVENSLIGTRPSDLRPTSITASSFSIAITVPVTTEPSMRSRSRRDSSSIAAKSSDEGMVSVAVCACGHKLVQMWKPDAGRWSCHRRLGLISDVSWEKLQPRPERPGLVPRCSRDVSTGDRERGIDILVGRADRPIVTRRQQRRDRARSIARVTLPQILEDAPIIAEHASAPALLATAARAFFGGGGDEDLAAASGRTTVPISRPASTGAAAALAERRWKASSASRTAGMAATLERPDSICLLVQARARRARPAPAPRPQPPPAPSSSSACPRSSRRRATTR